MNSKDLMLVALVIIFIILLTGCEAKTTQGGRNIYITHPEPGVTCYQPSGHGISCLKDAA